MADQLLFCGPSHSVLRSPLTVEGNGGHTAQRFIVKSGPFTAAHPLFVELAFVWGSIDIQSQKDRRPCGPPSTPYDCQRPKMVAKASAKPALELFAAPRPRKSSLRTAAPSGSSIRLSIS